MAILVVLKLENLDVYFVREGFKKQIKRSGWAFDIDVWFGDLKEGLKLSEFSRKRGRGAGRSCPAGEGGYCQIRVTPLA